MSNYIKKHGEIIPNETRSLISKRYHTISKAVNMEFWGSTSDTANSFYVGSYGRGTAINTSDLDVLVVLPETEYNRYNTMKGNGQSRLLQAVRTAILGLYPRSDIRADGQVVKVFFSDDMKFEILPAFENKPWNGIGNSTYRYPDSNMGGNWRSTNPKAEQEAMKKKNNSSNGLLYDTCKHIRYVRDNYFSSYHLSGIVIDSFVYQFIDGWQWVEYGDTSKTAPGTYENMLLDYLNQHIVYGHLALNAPGSNQTVLSSDSIECLKKVIHFIAQ